MTIFRLASLEEGRSITLDTTTPLFGRVAVTYQVTPTATDRSRLVAKLAFVALEVATAGSYATSYRQET